MAKVISQYPTQTASSPSLFDQIIGILPLIVIIFIAIIVIVLVLRWLMTKKERAKDIYRKDYMNTVEQCKLCKNYKWLKPILGMPASLINKGVPVMLNYPPLHYSKQYVGKEKRKLMEDSGMVATNDEVGDKISIGAGESYLLGSYAGHCVTKDGCYNLWVKSARKKIMFIFPQRFILKLRLPHVQKVIDSKDPGGKKTEFLEVPPDSVNFSNDIIIVNAMSIEKHGEYYYTVNMDGNGYIVDTKPYIYNDMIEISTQKQVMDLGRNMAIIAEEMVRGNPLVQFLRKTDTTLTGE